MDDHTRALADALTEGVEALREHRPHAAARALHTVASDPDLARADDLRDVRARACSLLSQALLDTGRPSDAIPWIRVAARLFRRLDDETGVEQAASLQMRAVEALAERTRALAEQSAAAIASTPIEALLADATDDEQRVDVLLAKANAELDRGADGTRLARRALDLGTRIGSIRAQVLARLTLARAAPDTADAELGAAWQIAEAADEFNLVGAVARAAKLSGVQLPRLDGPEVT